MPAKGYAINVVREPGVVRASIGGHEIAQSKNALRMAETSLDDCLYFPRQDVEMERFKPNDLRTFCPFKGTATYWDIELPGGRTVARAAWSYDRPLQDALQVPGFLAFDPVNLDEKLITSDPQTDPRPAVSSPLATWIIRRAFLCRSPEDLVRDMARFLVSSGMPLWRVSVGIWTLHPLLAGRFFTWTRDDDEVRVGETPHGALKEPAYINSPVRYVSEGLGGVRQRLDAQDAEFDFPVMEELRAGGGTDYVAMPLPFSDGRIQTMTLTSDDPAGFSTADLGPIFECTPTISRYFEVLTIRADSRALLHTYLGQRTGEQVLLGRTRRGDRQDILAAVLYCDLRDSTGWSQRLSRDAYLSLLNGFFECTVDAITAQRGEVLKFIGDAVLAIFPAEPDNAANACQAASRAARAILPGVAALTGRPGHKVECVIGLHFGELSYGNVGSPDRLDFTAIGTAAGIAARLCDLAKVVGVPIALSRAAGRYLSDVRSIGTHDLHRVRDPVEVFTPSDVDRVPADTL